MKFKGSMSLVHVSACVLSLSMCHSSFAQPVITQTKDIPAVPVKNVEPEGEHKATAIRLKHVTPSMMAWWIDPAHQQKPKQYEKPLTDFSGQYAPRADVHKPETKEPQVSKRATSARKGGGVYDLPEGVERIVALDTQNVLIVYGTEAGTRELHGLIQYLDRQVRSVEITVRFIEINSENLRGLGLDFSSSNGPFTNHSGGLAAPARTFALAFVRKDINPQLDALSAEGKVRRLGMSQITTPNNMSADFTMRASASGENGNTFSTPIDIATEITPTLNADESVTVLIRPTMKWLWADGGFSTGSVQTVANVTAGDTIALTGIGDGKGRDILVLVSARSLPLPKAEAK